MFTVCVAGGCGTGKSSTLDALVSRSHLVLWILSSRNRALAADFAYLNARAVPHDRLVFGYSATRAYRLQELFTELVSAVPPDRAGALRAAKALRVAPIARLDREVRRERMHRKREGMLRRKP